MKLQFTTRKNTPKRFENKTEHAIFKLPDKFRREVESDFESLSVSNGTITWNYDELLNIAIKTEAVRENLEKRGFARWVEKVWIDKEQLYLVKLKGKTIIQFRRGEEEFSWTTEYREIKFNVRVSDEVFSFTPPRDAKIVSLTLFSSIEEAQKFVNFTVLKPSYTAGYEFEFATVIKDESEAIELSYGKENELGIFESLKSTLQDGEEVRIKDTEGRYKIDLGVRKIEFNYKGLWVTVASEKT